MILLLQHLTTSPGAASLSLHTPPQIGLSVLTYNVLLPNSKDGWWNYKMYDPDKISFEKTLWPARQALILDSIKESDADIVCFQEVSPESFEEDFGFMMTELDYDGYEMFKRGRFRPATFWKTNRVALACPPVHKDRTLLTTFTTVMNDDGQDNKKDEETDASTNKAYWHVLNCHLQAGKQGGRRVRQMLEGAKAVVNQEKKFKDSIVKDPSNPLLIVCGDFNGGDECGALRLLEDGIITPHFIEDGEPVTSKDKKLPFAKPLRDVSALAIDSRPPPPTLVVAELISQMVEMDDVDDLKTAYDNPKLSNDVKSRLLRIFESFASEINDDGVMIMNKSDVENWLTKINGVVGRGSEFRAAAREMGWKPPSEVEEGGEKPRTVLPDDGVLTYDQFVQVYQEELEGGKFWGISYDLTVLGERLPDLGVFEARFDRIYCSDAVEAVCIVDRSSLVPCPNDIEPSDHLPVGAGFVLKVHH